MVVMLIPDTAETGMPQERTGALLRCTVHAPHCEMPHPNLVPLRLRTSRSTQSNGISGGTSTVVGFPLTVREMGMRGGGWGEPKCQRLSQCADARLESRGRRAGRWPASG